MSRSFRIDPSLADETKQERTERLRLIRERAARRRTGRRAFNFIQDRKAERREIAWATLPSST